MRDDILTALHVPERGRLRGGRVVVVLTLALLSRGAVWMSPPCSLGRKAQELFVLLRARGNLDIASADLGNLHERIVEHLALFGEEC